MSKKCINCAKPISDKRGDARFCSLACKNKYSYKGRLGNVVNLIKEANNPKIQLSKKTLEDSLNGVIKQDSPAPQSNASEKNPSSNIDAEIFNELMNESLFNVDNKLEQIKNTISVDANNNAPETETFEIGTAKTEDAILNTTENTLPEMYISKVVKVKNQEYIEHQTYLEKYQQYKHSLEKEYQRLSTALKEQESRTGNELLLAGIIGGSVLGFSNTSRSKDKKTSNLELTLKTILCVAVGTGLGYAAKGVTKDWREKDRLIKIAALKKQMDVINQDYSKTISIINSIKGVLLGIKPFLMQTKEVFNPEYTNALMAIATKEMATNDTDTLKGTKPLPKNNQQAPPISFKSDRIIKAKELGKREYKAINFKGLWKEFFGLPPLNFHILIHGNSGEGKSTFCLWFARYLAENFGRVLYVSSEEGLNKTFHDKLKSCEAEVDNLYIIDSGSGDEFINEVGDNEFHFIILDSLHDMEIDAHKLKFIFERYKNTAFICIDQNNKKGELLGANEKKHINDVVVNVKNYTAETTKNRFQDKGKAFKTADFTKYSKIHFKDPNRNKRDDNNGYNLDSDRRGIV